MREGGKTIVRVGWRIKYSGVGMGQVFSLFFFVFCSLVLFLVLCFLSRDASCEKYCDIVLFSFVALFVVVVVCIVCILFILIISSKFRCHCFFCFLIVLFQS